MFTYTTCRDCGGPLHITTHEQNVHPDCTPKPTKTEQLTKQFINALMAGDETRADEIESRIHELEHQPPRLQAAAQIYARWGWPVFPLKPLSKLPATRNGFKDATTDLTRIITWWTRHPTANIGLATGHAFDVIDIDPPEGHKSLDLMLSKVDPATGKGPLPDCHGRVMTQSAGLHLYVKPDHRRRNKTGHLPGIDIRSKGGYVVAPPSLLGPRQRYSWTVHPSPVIKKTA
jgi:hypothetical protein